MKPDEIQDINNKLVDRLNFVENRKNVIPKKIIANDGLISFDVPFQCFL